MSTRLFLIFLTLVSFLLTIIWFRSGLILGGGEEGLAFYNPSKTYELSKSMWWDYNGGFATLQWLPKITSFLPVSLLYAKLNFPNYLLQAITYFILILVGGISVYLLTLTLLENKYNFGKTVAFVAAIVYILNPYSFSQIWGRSLNSQFFSFSLLPAALLFFLQGLEGKFMYLFYLTLSSFVFSDAFGITTFVITYWIVLTVSLIYWVIINRKDRKKILHACVFFTLSLIFWLLVHSWWFLPTIISGGNIYSNKLVGLEENLGTLLGVSRSFTPDVIIRLLHKGYFFDATAYSPIYSTFIFQLISFLIPLFLTIGLIVAFMKKELKKFRLFILLFVLGLVISLGANPPLGWLFVWIFKQVPFLQSFRNPYEKFGLVYALAYSAVFAVGLIYIFEQKLKLSRVKFLGILAVLTFTCGIYAWPMWTGKVVSSPNSVPGIDVPNYYSQLNNWLDVNNKERYQIFMTPLWAGEGAFYQWNKTRYQGLDPTMYILDSPAISSSPKFPYFYDFMQSIRKYMESEDVAPALSLLRAKFLIDRKDAIMVTDSERDQYKFLTSTIYPTQGFESNLKIICSNMTTDSKTNDLAWIVCHIPREDSDLSKVKYLHVKVKTDLPADIRVALRDIKDVRINWNGRVDSDYRTYTNNWHYITLPLDTPSENDSRMDLSKTDILEVWANIQGSLEKSVGIINISEIKLDQGTKKEINEFKKVAEFGNLSVFEPVYFNPAPEFGSLSSINQVQDFAQLFAETNKKRNLTNKEGFVLMPQNTQKDLKSLPKDTSLQIIDKNKISDSRYWLKVNGVQGQGLLLLSKNFHPQWKVITGVSKDKLSGNFFDDLKLLEIAVLPEDNHFVVNGYANLWKVGSTDTQYAIVFIPQIIADVSAKVSIVSIVVMIGFTTVWGLKNLFISARRNRFRGSI